jgi:hypothetical protein
VGCDKHHRRKSLIIRWLAAGGKFTNQPAGRAQDIPEPLRDATMATLISWISSSAHNHFMPNNLLRLQSSNGNRGESQHLKAW